MLTALELTPYIFETILLPPSRSMTSEAVRFEAAMTEAYSGHLKIVKGVEPELKKRPVSGLIRRMTPPLATSVSEIAKRLRLMRRALGLSQVAFCGRAKIATNTYNQWEQAKGRPELDKAFLMCDTFGVTLDWIYRGERACLPHELATKIERIAASEADAVASPFTGDGSARTSG